MVKIIDIEPGSLAAGAGIEAGDLLVSINKNPIRDVLDYRFYLTEKRVELVCERGGERYEVDIRKDEYDDIGLIFETPLMDKKQRCANKCIFCFIDQLPSGMRETLYFKDDDSRLSFLHGNYITLTNLTDADIDRIIKMRISPLRVSVHTTNPELRVKMMKNRRAGEVLRYLEKIAAAGLDIDAQIVLCRSINDGAELGNTMRELLAYYPALGSVSVVPAGLTGHRSGLYPLLPHTPEECAGIINQALRVGDECLLKHGSRIFFPADELYIKAGVGIPDSSFYEDFSQLENGVGLVALLRDEFYDELRGGEIRLSSPRRVSVATGEAAFGLISSLAGNLCRAVSGLDVNVFAVKNNFFGGEVNVAGLLTGGDIAEQLANKPLGEELLIPAAALRAGEDIFLDDMTVEELGARLGVPIRPVSNDARELFRALLGQKP